MCAYRALLVLKLGGLVRFWMFTRVQREVGVDAFQYRKLGELKYVARLIALDKCLIAFWADLIDVDNRALCFTEPQLCVNLRFINKSSFLCWTSSVHHEHQARTTTGYALIYQNVTQNNIAAAKKDYVCKADGQMVSNWGAGELLCGTSAFFLRIRRVHWWNRDRGTRLLDALSLLRRWPLLSCLMLTKFLLVGTVPLNDCLPSESESQTSFEQRSQLQRF